MFQVNNYLSDKQAATFHTLPRSLQQSLEDNLCSEQTARIQVVRNILEVIQRCSANASAQYSRYFTLLLAGRGENDAALTAQLVEIAVKGKIDEFFAAGWTDTRCLTITSLETATGDFLNQVKRLRLSPPPMPVFTEKSASLFFSALQEWLKTVNSPLSFEKIKQHKTLEDPLKIAVAKIALAAENIKQEDIDRIANMSEKICQTYGEEFLYKVAGSMKAPLSSQDAMAIFTYLSSIDNDELFGVVDRFDLKQITLAQFHEILAGKLPIPQIENSEDRGIDYLLSRLNTDPTVELKLSEEHLRKIREQYLKVEEYCQSWKKCTLFQLIQKVKELESSEDANKLEKLIALGRLSLFHFQKKFLYSTQIFTVLGILAGNKSTIAQVKTGEGKSLISTLLAFTLAVQGRAVDVISSSPSLSKRDAVKFQPFFAQFDLSSGHICYKEPKPEYFKPHILYGTPTDFEFALMREQLYFYEFFKHRPRASFDAVIVDEADNLTIDTQLNAARLAIPAPFSFEWVYTPLYQALSKDPDLTAADLRNLLLQYEGGKYVELVNALEDKQLLTWKNSALKAKRSVEKEEYVIRMRKKEPAVVIVDKENTGQLKWGSRWQNGVHEFLEVKHRIPVQKESLTPLSISHVVFYRKYKSLYGLTGTLGSVVEKEQMAETYNVLLFDVPPFRPCIREDLPPIILDNPENYYEAIQRTTREKLAHGRPVLIICESIEDTLVLSERFNQTQIQHQLFNEIQEEDEESILEKAGDPGRVTITTNNAGRGTDILLTTQSKQNGGLHVIIAFYPDSLRVERQAIGRAGRQGEPGSSQMIIWVKHLSLFDYFSLGLSRQVKEAHRAAYCKSRAEVELFTQPLIEEFYKQLGAFQKTIFSAAFCQKFGNELSNYLLFSLPSLPLPLHQEDRLIKNEITALILNRNFSEDQKAHKRTRWQDLLQRVGHRIIDRCLQEWSISFFKPSEEVNVTDREIAAKKGEITLLFNQVREKWECYLKNPAQGVAAYIKELTGTDLTGIISAHVIF
jgi:preprotein translocase subunit SecA